MRQLKITDLVNIPTDAASPKLQPTPNFIGAVPPGGVVPGTSRVKEKKPGMKSIALSKSQGRDTVKSTPVKKKSAVCASEGKSPFADHSDGDDIVICATPPGTARVKAIPEKNVTHTISGEGVTGDSATGKPYPRRIVSQTVGKMAMPTKQLMPTLRTEIQDGVIMDKITATSAHSMENVPREGFLAVSPRDSDDDCVIERVVTTPKKANAKKKPLKKGQTSDTPSGNQEVPHHLTERRDWKSTPGKVSVKREFLDLSADSDSGVVEEVHSQTPGSRKVAGPKPKRKSTTAATKINPKEQARTVARDLDCEIVNVKHSPKEQETVDSHNARTLSAPTRKTEVHHTEDCEIIAVLPTPPKVKRGHAQNMQQTKNKATAGTYDKTSHPKIKVEPGKSPKKVPASVTTDTNTKIGERLIHKRNDASPWAPRQPISSVKIDLTNIASSDESDMDDLESPSLTRGAASIIQQTPLKGSQLGVPHNPYLTPASAKPPRPVQMSHGKGYGAGIQRDIMGLTRPSGLITPSEKRLRKTDISYCPPSAQAETPMDICETDDDVELENDKDREMPFKRYSSVPPHRMHSGVGVSGSPSSAIGYSEGSVASSPTARLSRTRARTLPIQDATSTYDKLNRTLARTEQDLASSATISPVTSESTVTATHPKPLRNIRSQFIRDGVSEHAIQPTLHRLRARIDAGLEFTHLATGGTYDASCVTLQDRGAYGERVLSTELMRRGIKAQTQVDNFWNNLTVEYSRLAGFSFPALSMRVKAQNDFLEECLELEASLAGWRNEEKKKKNEKKLTPAEQLELWKQEQADDDETDGESGSETEDEDKDADLETLLKKQEERRGKKAVASSLPTAVATTSTVAKPQEVVDQQSPSPSASVQLIMEENASQASKERSMPVDAAAAFVQAPASHGAMCSSDSAIIHANKNEKITGNRKRRASDDNVAPNIGIKKSKVVHQMDQGSRKPSKGSAQRLQSKRLEKFYAQFMKKVKKQDRMRQHAPRGTMLDQA